MTEKRPNNSRSPEQNVYTRRETLKLGASALLLGLAHSDTDRNQTHTSHTLIGEITQDLRALRTPAVSSDAVPADQQIEIPHEDSDADKLKYAGKITAGVALIFGAIGEGIGKTYHWTAKECHAVAVILAAVGAVLGGIISYVAYHSDKGDLFNNL